MVLNIISVNLLLLLEYHLVLELVPNHVSKFYCQVFNISTVFNTPECGRVSPRG